MTTISRTKTKSISIIVVPEYLLTQDDDFLASISRGRVVRDVHDLQLLLGLGIINW